MIIIMRPKSFKAILLIVQLLYLIFYKPVENSENSLV